MICKYCGIVDKPHKCYRFRKYTDKEREDKKIYKTSQWQRKRIEILEHFDYICLWSYFIEGKAIVADNIHHITEIIEDNSKAFDNDNLIPLCEKAHKIVHELYKIDKIKTKNMLKRLIFEYEEGNNLGKYKQYNIPPYYFVKKTGIS